MVGRVQRSHTATTEILYSEAWCLTEWLTQTLFLVQPVALAIQRKFLWLHVLRVFP